MKSKFAACLLATPLLGCQVFHADPGELAPPFSGITSEGENISMLDLSRSRKLVIVFLHPDGKHGLEALHVAKRLQEQVGADQLAVAGVVASPVRDFELWTSKYNPPIPVIPDPDRRITLNYKMSVSPSVQVVGAKGTLGRRFTSWSRQSVEDLAAEFKVDPKQIWTRAEAPEEDSQKLDQ